MRGQIVLSPVEPDAWSKVPVTHLQVSAAQQAACPRLGYLPALPAAAQGILLPSQMDPCRDTGIAADVGGWLEEGQPQGICWSLSPRCKQVLACLLLMY